MHDRAPLSFKKTSLGNRQSNLESSTMSKDASDKGLTPGPGSGSGSGSGSSSLPAAGNLSEASKVLGKVVEGDLKVGPKEKRFYLVLLNEYLCNIQSCTY